MFPPITVTTGARLHFGPLSYRPGVGRHFGGVGVMLEEPGFRVSLRITARDAVSVDGFAAERVRQFVGRYRETCPVDRQPPPCEVVIENEMPSHCGLGSGTQLGLAVARGLATLAGEQDALAAELARRIGRGRRSAVGIHGFEQGGLIVDAGQQAGGEIGTLACRLPLPDTWRVLLISPHEGSMGLSGAGEDRAFDALGSMPQALTERLCRIVLTELLPAVQSEEFERFSEALFDYGRHVGEFFAPVQGGTFGHPRTDSLIADLRQLGIPGAGQTSWGPTVFAFAPDDERSQRIAATLSDGAAVDVRIVGLRNRGATVENQFQNPVSRSARSLFEGRDITETGF